MLKTWASITLVGVAIMAPRAPVVAAKTEDTELEQQIDEVSKTLTSVHQDIAIRRQELEQETDQAKKVALQGELNKFREERDSLEKLLHQLSDEAKPMESTQINQALNRTRRLEKAQERQYEHEEILRDRQQAR